MRVLGVDTVSKSCSVSIVEKQALISELTLSKKETHARHLMGMIDHVTRLSGMKPGDLDGYSVTIGPGSFTGIRIGISTVKGLAAGSGKPVVGVSSLDALANALSNTSKLICTMLDARRGEVYFSCYKYQNGCIKKICPEQALPPEKVVATIKEPCIFIGDGSMVYKKVIQDELGELACFADLFQNEVKASIVGKLGIDRMESKGVQSHEDLKPFYIRKCDAEIKKDTPKP